MREILEFGLRSPDRDRADQRAERGEKSDHKRDADGNDARKIIARNVAVTGRDLALFYQKFFVFALLFCKRFAFLFRQFLLALIFIFAVVVLLVRGAGSGNKIRRTLVSSVFFFGIVILMYRIVLFIVMFHRIYLLSRRSVFAIRIIL